MIPFTLKSALVKLEKEQYTDLLGYDLEEDEAYIYIKNLAENPESCNTCNLVDACEMVKHVKAQTGMSLQEMRFSCFTSKGD